MIKNRAENRVREQAATGLWLRKKLLRIVPLLLAGCAQPTQGVRDTPMALVPTGIRVQRQAEELAASI